MNVVSVTLNAVSVALDVVSVALNAVSVALDVVSVTFVFLCIQNIPGIHYFSRCLAHGKLGKRQLFRNRTRMNGWITIAIAIICFHVHRARNSCAIFILYRLCITVCMLRNAITNSHVVFLCPSVSGLECMQLSSIPWVIISARKS